MSDSIRADKWLWATRFFKTRGLAADFCTEGKVMRNGHVLKPASPVQPGDLLEVPFHEGPGTRTARIIAIIAKRVGAPEARACYEDLTEPAQHGLNRQWFAAKMESGKGRPTKKDRRDMNRVRGFWD